MNNEKLQLEPNYASKNDLGNVESTMEGDIEGPNFVSKFYIKTHVLFLYVLWKSRFCFFHMIFLNLI